MSRLIERAKAAEAHAEKVRRDVLLMVRPSVIEAFIVAVDAWEEANDEGRADVLRAFVAEMKAIDAFMWTADANALDEKWPCKCCCHEHTSEGCSARMWGGCRGQGSESLDPESWIPHYERFHGMTRDQFYGT